MPRFRALSRPLAVVMPLLFLAPLGLADTNVGGLIITDTHWTAASGPYVVTDSIVVVNDATLIIDPGVEVRFASSTRLEIGSGTLIARGTVTDKISFTANVSGIVTDAERWDQIKFGDEAHDAVFDVSGNYVAGSIVEHAVIEYAGWWSYLSTENTTWYPDKEGAIRAESSSPFVSNSLIRENIGGGIAGIGSTGLRLVGNTITNNFPQPAILSEGVYVGKGGGVYLRNTSDVVLDHNVLIGNRAGIINGSSGSNQGTVNHEPLAHPRTMKMGASEGMV